MTIITISKDTADMLHEFGRRSVGYQDTSTRLPDGTCVVDINDEDLDRMRAQQMPGETDDETMARILRAVLKKKAS